MLTQCATKNDAFISHSFLFQLAHLMDCVMKVNLWGIKCELDSVLFFPASKWARNNDQLRRSRFSCVILHLIMRIDKYGHWKYTHTHGWSSISYSQVKFGLHSFMLMLNHVRRTLYTIRSSTRHVTLTPSDGISIRFDIEIKPRLCNFMQTEPATKNPIKCNRFYGHRIEKLFSRFSSLSLHLLWVFVIYIFCFVLLMLDNNRLDAVLEK